MRDTNFDISDLSKEQIINSLKPYQAKAINALLEEHTHEKAAEIWFTSSGPLQVDKFGGGGPPNPLWQKFKQEFRQLICGDDKYKKLREDLSKLAQPLISSYITYISIALAPSVGITSVALAPVIALMLLTVSTLGVNAWCAL